MKKLRPNKKLGFILLRYIILLALGLSLPVFYTILLPLTIQPVNFILNLFYDSFIKESSILVSGKIIQILDACVAGSAYYLLLILNLSVSMNAKTRVKSVIFSLLSLLVINIARISVFSLMFLESFSAFDFTHKLFWYALSGVFVAAIWILSIFIFKIKEVPFYTDIKTIVKCISW